MAGVRFLAVARNFFLLHSVQTGSESTHPPIKWVLVALSLEVKQQMREAEHSPPSRAELKNDGDIPQFPQYIFVAWCLIN
jgi:hypothetical protein